MTTVALGEVARLATRTPEGRSIAGGSQGPPHVWKTFWGEDSIESWFQSQNVVPGAWRIEYPPSVPAEEDLFFMFWRIGNLEKSGQATELGRGHFVSAASGAARVLSAPRVRTSAGEVSLPDLACDS